MRYFVTISMREDVGAPPPELAEAMSASMADAFQAGVMLDAGGLGPASASTRIELRGGALSRVDGPYAEAKEVVGGYAILDARSHEEAVELARRTVALHLAHWPGWEGSAEVRPIFGPDQGPQS